MYEFFFKRHYDVIFPAKNPWIKRVPLCKIFDEVLISKRFSIFSALQKLLNPIHINSLQEMDSVDAF